MIESSIRDRVKRGIALVDRVEAHGDLHTVEASGGGFFYTVNVEGETCSCKDFQRCHLACKHLFAVVVFEAKGRRHKTARPKTTRH